LRSCVDGDAFFGAAVNGHMQVLQKLLESRADVTLKNREGNGGVHGAASTNNVQALQLLLQARAKPDAANHQGDTALHIAARKGYLKGPATLMEYLANIQAMNCEGNTALRVAACYGQSKVTTLLLRRKADVKLNNSVGQTALHGAAGGGHVDIVRMLLECAANVRVRDKNGRTSLHLAAAAGHLDVIQPLCEQLADPRSEIPVTWKSAIDLARDNYHVECLYYMQSLPVVEKPDVKEWCKLRAEHLEHRKAEDALLPERAMPAVREPVQLTVPEGLTAGDTFTVEADGTVTFDVQVPEGLGPGDTFEIDLADYVPTKSTLTTKSTLEEDEEVLDVDLPAIDESATKEEDKEEVTSRLDEVQDEGLGATRTEEHGGEATFDGQVTLLLDEVQE